MSLNVFTFSGRLTATPTYKEVNDNTVYNFSVAVNNYAGKDKESEVFYVECNLWGDRGKYLAKFDKGTEISVVGKLTPRKWVTKEGVEKTVLGCFVNDYEVYNKSSSADKPERQKSGNQTTGKRIVQEPEPEDDDDIPF